MRTIASAAALVIVDVQNAIDDPKWGPRNNPDAEKVIAGLLAEWRSMSWPVVHIRHCSTFAQSPYRPGQPGNEFKAAVAPVAGEAVIAKSSNSAFVNTNLADHLEQIGATTLVVCGVLTSNSLETTVRHAGNLGYSVHVASDGCWAVDTIDLRGRRWAAEDVHQLSLAHMHGEYASVATGGEIVLALRGSKFV